MNTHLKQRLRWFFLYKNGEKYARWNTSRYLVFSEGDVGN